MSRARARNGKPAKVSAERMYEVIRRPVVTEKSTLGSAHNKVTFVVPLDASKPEIKAAVEQVFKVKVKAVNTLRHKGKTRPEEHTSELKSLMRVSYAVFCLQKK